MNKAQVAAAILGVSEMTAHRYAREAGGWNLVDLKRVKKMRAAYKAGDTKRRAQAARLRAKGWTWERVGHRMGITASCACKLAARAEDRKA